jgi:hypothetical protein
MLTLAPSHSIILHLGMGKWITDVCIVEDTQG